MNIVLDDGSFESWDSPVEPSTLDEDYLSALREAQSRTGTDEAVVSGRARIDGEAVAVLVSEFGFFGGSIGRDAAGRLVRSIRRATQEGLPIIAAPASGGTRMQEGTPAFVEMVTVVRAVIGHKAAGLPFLVYLRNPTTGGVFASWGSLGHVTFAEPDALVGFLGPRVFEALSGRRFPTGVQTAENLADKGVLDGVVPMHALADVLVRLVRLARQGPLSPTMPMEEREIGSLSRRRAWESVVLTRRADRPGVAALLRFAAHDTVFLSGSGAGERGIGMMLAITDLAGMRCVVLGHDREHPNAGAVGPGALRVARRGFRLARDLRLPLVTVIDTPGAELSPNAEEAALAGEIARCLAELCEPGGPTVALLMGQGCGGAALALLPTARVVAAEHAWLAPLPPEGASSIMHRTVGQAARMADCQRISATDLLSDGIVDVVVPEVPAAHEDPEGFCQRVAAACVAQIREQIEDVTGLTNAGVKAGSAQVT